MDQSAKCVPVIVHLPSDDEEDDNDDGDAILDGQSNDSWWETTESVRAFIQARMEADFITPEDSSELIQILLDRISTKALPDLDTFENIYDLLNITSNLVDLLIKSLSPLITDSTANPLRDRNVCLLLYVLSKRYLDFYTKLASPRVIFNYLGGLINSDTCDNAEVILWALLDAEMLLERLPDKQDYIKPIKADIEPRIKEMAAKFINSNAYDKNADAFEYQAGFVAQNFYENFLINTSIMDDDYEHIRTVKLSSDCLSARSDDAYAMPPVRSAFAVTGGVFYYEVILFTSGSVRLGWCTRETEFGEGLDLGDDESSIALNGAYRSVVHKCVSIPLDRFPNWKVGDVIGCLIDQPNRRFEFYLNGEPIAFDQCEVHFSTSQPYFACASLAPLQHCVFNFGQMPFRYPIVRAKSFHHSTNGDGRKYRLLEPGFAAIWYWFKQCPIDGTVDPVFQNDQIQEEFNKWIVDETTNVDLKSLIKVEFDWLRLFQSLLTELKCDNSEIGSQVERIKQSIGTIDPNTVDFPSVSKLLEFIYPYLQLDQSSDHFNRNLTIVLSIIADRKDKDWETVTLILQEASPFLKRILYKHSADCWIHYAKTCLEVIDQSIN